MGAFFPCWLMILPLKIHAEFSNYTSWEIFVRKKRRFLLLFQINLISPDIRFIEIFARIIPARGQKSRLFISGKWRHLGENTISRNLLLITLSPHPLLPLRLALETARTDREKSRQILKQEESFYWGLCHLAFVGGRTKKIQKEIGLIWSNKRFQVESLFQLSFL